MDDLTTSCYILCDLTWIGNVNQTFRFWQTLPPSSSIMEEAVWLETALRLRRVNIMWKLHLFVCSSVVFPLNYVVGCCHLLFEYKHGDLCCRNVDYWTFIGNKNVALMSFDSQFNGKLSLLQMVCIFPTYTQSKVRIKFKDSVSYKQTHQRFTFIGPFYGFSHVYHVYSLNVSIHHSPHLALNFHNSTETTNFHTKRSWDLERSVKKRVVLVNTVVSKLLYTDVSVHGWHRDKHICYDS